MIDSPKEEIQSLKGRVELLESAIAILTTQLSSAIAIIRNIRPPGQWSPEAELEIKREALVLQEYILSLVAERLTEIRNPKDKN